MQIRRGWIPLTLIAVVVLIGVLWVTVFNPAEPVDAARIQRGTLEVTLPVTGLFETRTADLTFEIPGRLASVLVREGQAVQQGEILASLNDAELQALATQAASAAVAVAKETTRSAAVLDAAREQVSQAEAAHRAAQANLAQLRAGARPQELRQAESAVAAARSALEQARRTLATQEQLLREGAVPRVQVDAARAQVESAQAQYDQALAHLETLRAGARPEAITAAAEQVAQAAAAWRAAQANVRQAEALVAAARAQTEQARAAADAARARAGRAQLRAPFDGAIGRIYLNPGAAVAPAVPVLSIVSLSGWVTADVDEADIGKIRAGLPARVTADAYPGQQWAGRVTRIAEQVDVRLGTRTVRVRIDLDLPVRLRAGTSVDVDLILQVVPDALLAPVEAVSAGDNAAAHVYVIDRGVLRQRPVLTGAQNEQYVQIRRGLNEGDLVAIAEPARLRDGARVRPRPVP